MANLIVFILLVAMTDELYCKQVYTFEIPSVSDTNSYGEYRRYVESELGTKVYPYRDIVRYPKGGLVRIESRGIPHHEKFYAAYRHYFLANTIRGITRAIALPQHVSIFDSPNPYVLTQNKEMDERFYIPSSKTLTLNHTLEYLDLYGVDISVLSRQSRSEYFQGVTEIYPNLSYFGVPYRTKLADLRHFGQMNSLKHLNLSASQIQGGGSAEQGTLIKALRKFPELEYLDLRHLIDVSGALVDIENGSRIQMLNLAYTDVRSQDLEHLSRMVGLKKLMLHYTDVDDNCFKQLSKFKNLSYVSLYCTKVTSSGVKSFADANPLVMFDIMRPVDLDEYLDAMHYHFLLDLSTEEKVKYANDLYAEMQEERDSPKFIAKCMVCLVCFNYLNQAGGSMYEEEIRKLENILNPDGFGYSRILNARGIPKSLDKFNSYKKYREDYDLDLLGLPEFQIYVTRID